MSDTILTFQRRIGPKRDRTWEDLDIPPACQNAVQIMAALRANRVTGVFRVVEEQDECFASTVTFEVKEVKDYEVVEIAD